MTAGTRIPVRTEWSVYTLGSVPERVTDFTTGEPKFTRDGDEVWKANVVENREGALPNVLNVKFYHRPLDMPLGTRLDIDFLMANPWAFIDEKEKKLVEGVTFTCDALEPHPDVADAILAANREAGNFAVPDNTETTEAAGEGEEVA